MNKSEWSIFKQNDEEYQKNYIQEKLKEGMTKTALGELLGTSRNSISRLITKLGIEEEVVQPIQDSVETPQEAITGDSMGDRVTKLEAQVKQLTKAINSIQNDAKSIKVNQNESKLFKIKKYDKKGAIQSTVRLHTDVNKKLESFYNENDVVNKNDLLNSLLEWALSQVMK